MRDLTTINLYDLVPDSIRDDPDVKASIDSLNGEIQAVSALCMAPALYARIDELDSNTLDHLAWQVNSKVWRDTWPLNIKRAFIKQVILEKAKRGTLSALMGTLQSLGSAVEVREWWQTSPQGSPYTFDITISVNDAVELTSQSAQDLLVQAIDNVIPARCHYTLSLAVQTEGSVGFGGGARFATYVHLTADEKISGYLAAESGVAILDESGYAIEREG